MKTGMEAIKEKRDKHMDEMATRHFQPYVVAAIQRGLKKRHEREKKKVAASS